MIDATKCRVMPDGKPAVMCYLLHMLDEEDMKERVAFVPMRQWNDIDCETVDVWVRVEDQAMWEVAEQTILEHTWERLKDHIFNTRWRQMIIPK